MDESENIYLCGAGGHGKVMIEMIKLSSYNLVGIFDDQTKMGSLVKGVPIIGKINDINDICKEGANIVIAIGNGIVRSELFKTLKINKFKLPSIVHPSSIVSEGALISEGVAILPGAIIANGTIISNGCIINSNVCVDHDCIIGEFSHLGISSSVPSMSIIDSFTYLKPGKCY